MSRARRFSSPLAVALFCLVAVILLGASDVARAADDWADLTGRFVFDGPPPVAPKLVVNKDTEVCGKHPLVDESLVVGPDGGIANVIVYVRSAKVKTHPDLAKFEPEVVLDNKNCRFEPHVLPVQLGQTLILRNSDPVGHNSNVQPLGDQGVNPLIAAGTDAKHKFNKKQLLPVPVSCNIHNWMKAYVLPRDNPYTAVSDEKGNFTIKNLPVGEKLEFQVWQEKAGYLEAKPEWKKGRFEMTLKKGDNNLGDIKVKPALFQKK